ncbi:DUF397 domain-containing protein [Spirillospora sp. NPDC050679]
MDQVSPPFPPTTWRKSSHSGPEGGDCVEVATVWHKSSHSSAQGSDCVEVAAVQHLHLIRDSKAPHGPVLAMPPTTWTALLGDIKHGTHDLR